ncbi:MAG: HU family DNA-binding protein [Candidatus Cloacimonetes bacterium]|nr:HU family DNA-binding protein [Candidatus Cloacimonadota bacterium]
MSREDLITRIAKDADITKKAAAAALNGFIDGVMGALEKGDKVSLVGFGTFDVVKRAKRKGINPQTKKPITIPARKVPVFRAGKKLKEAVK